MAAPKSLVGRSASSAFLILALTAAHFHVNDARLLPTLSPLAGTFLGDSSEHGQCARDSRIMAEAAANRSLWAMRMLDASAHEPSGVLWGANYQLGSFDGCLSAGEQSPVGARYCIAVLEQPCAPLRAASWSPSELSQCPEPRKLIAGLSRPWESVSHLPPDQHVDAVLVGEGQLAGSQPLGDVRVALCVPRSCGPDAMQAAIQASLAAEHPARPARPALAVSVRPELCREQPDGPRSTAGLLLWCVLALLTLASLTAPYFGWTAWDWRTHLRALGSPDSPVAGLDLSPLSGIRCLNAMYIVLLHNAVHSSRMPISNKDGYSTENRAQPKYAVLFRGGLAVDSFFFLAGLLLVVMRTERKEPLGKALLNRLLRVLPLYVLILVFYLTALPDVATGPIWAELTEPLQTSCRRWWWTNMLFINNYVHGGTAEYVCMEHTWSLAADMQLFVAGSLLLRWLPDDGVLQVAWLSALSVLSAMPRFVGTLLRGWPGTMPFTLDMLQRMWAEPLFHEYYTPTHMRLAPYVGGLLAGRVLLVLRDAGFRPGHGATVLLNAAGLAVMVAIMAVTAPFADFAAPHHPVNAALSAGFDTLVWSAGLAVIVVANVLGRPTFVRALLSWQPLVTLSRLTYAVYLVSYPLQALLAASRRDTAKSIPMLNAVSGLSEVVMSFLLCFWLYVVVEAPLRTLGKRALSSMSSETQPTKNGTSSVKSD